MVRVIKAAQRLGFTLDEVAALIDVGCHDLATCAEAPDCPLPFTEIASST